MIKKFTLLLLAMLCVASTNAKVFETQIWTGSLVAGSSDVVEIPVSSFTGLKAGDAIRVYITNTSGASYAIWYGKDKATTPRLTLSAHNDGWGWVNGGSEYEDVTLSADDVSNLEGKKIFIQNGTTEGSVLNKVAHYGEVSPSGYTDLLNESINFPSSWTNKSISAQATAKIGDVIRASYTCTNPSYIQIKYWDTSWSRTLYAFADNIYDTSGTLDFEITSALDLEEIQSNGFVIQGADFTLTSLKLLTYSDSYDAVSITVGSDGVATYSNGGKNVQISACDALKAYYASAVAEGTVTLTELTGCIPANTGVIVYGSEGTYTVPVGNDGWPAGWSTTTNYLKPTGDYSQDVARSVEGKYHYIFAKYGSDIGFYLLDTDYEEGGNTYHTLAAHKAYLETTENFTPPTPPTLSMGSRSYMRLSFGGGGGTTAINTTLKNPIVEDGLYYTLQGVAVKNPTKGIYILNGKKVFVK